MGYELSGETSSGQVWLDHALRRPHCLSLAHHHNRYDDFRVVGAASAEDCRPIIVKEGYLAQAQFECDFADLSEALTDASRKCGDGIGKDAVGEALKEGMEAAMAEVDKAGDPLGARVMQFSQEVLGIRRFPQKTGFWG